MKVQQGVKAIYIYIYIGLKIRRNYSMLFKKGVIG